LPGGRVETQELLLACTRSKSRDQHATVVIDTQSHHTSGLAVDNKSVAGRELRLNIGSVSDTTDQHGLDRDDQAKAGGPGNAHQRSP
jgi:hypothetical protein